MAAARTYETWNTNKISGICSGIIFVKIWGEIEKIYNFFCTVRYKKVAAVLIIYLQIDGHNYRISVADKDEFALGDGL